MVTAMRKFGSYLLILIFLTAYGRCVADQFGMLHTSETSCCVSICDTNDHCKETQNDHSEDSDSQEIPTPCQLCFILDSDSMLLEDSFEIPTPSFLDISNFFTFCTTLDDLLRSRELLFSSDLTLSDHPNPPTEQRSRLLRTTAKTTPVRGPSIA
jgi:hypothetical protein